MIQICFCAPLWEIETPPETFLFDDVSDWEKPLSALFLQGLPKVALLTRPVALVSFLGLPLPLPPCIEVTCHFLATSAGTDLHPLSFPLRKSHPWEKCKDMRITTWYEQILPNVVDEKVCTQIPSYLRCIDILTLNCGNASKVSVWKNQCKLMLLHLSKVIRRQGYFSCCTLDLKV